MKILILGSGGMLGSAILDFLSKSTNYDIYALKKEFEKIDHCFPNVNFIYGNAFDITNLNFNRNIQPNIIINCIGMINVDACEEYQKDAMELNANIVKLYHYHYPNSKFIFISTDSVFAGSSGNYIETDEISPLNYYAQTKLAGENFTKLFSNHMILRLNIYGFNKKRNSLCDWAIMSLENNNSINGFDNVYFNPLNVYQVAFLIEKLIIKNFIGTINLGSNCRLSKFNFLNKIAEVFNFEHKLITKTFYDPNKTIAKRPLDTTLNLTKLENLGIDIPDLNTGINLLKIQKNEQFSKNWQL
jgi:dTDP-4-dehydrorhamnose reductase